MNASVLRTFATEVCAQFVMTVRTKLYAVMERFAPLGGVASPFSYLPICFAPVGMIHVVRGWGAADGSSSRYYDV